MKDDVIVIASTSKDGNETEMTSISSVENDGYKIVLCNPVNFTHYGITDVLEDGQFIDIRYCIVIIESVHGSDLSAILAIPKLLH